jgi:hypothetical protein
MTATPIYVAVALVVAALTTVTTVLTVVVVAAVAEDVAAALKTRKLGLTCCSIFFGN